MPPKHIVSAAAIVRTYFFDQRSEEGLGNAWRAGGGG